MYNPTMPKVVITGVSRGIGKATAQKFLSEGWEVFGTSTSGQADWQDKNLHLYPLDLADAQSIAKFIQNLIKDIEEIDVLINNAGMQLGDEGLDWNADDLRKTLEVNLIGPADLTLKLIPHLKKGGSIINFSSGLGSLSDSFGDYEPTYQISKAAINKLTQVLAAALKSKNITVSSVDPGWVKTDMGGPSAPRKPEQPAEEVYKMAIQKLETGQFWHQNRKRSW